MKLNEKMKKYFCPPGNGVFTVHTAAELKEGLHKHLYETTEAEEVQKKWELSIDNFQQSSKVCLMGITMDTGGGIQRGANWGPLFLRNELLKNSNYDFIDLGDTRTIPQIIHDKYLNKETIESCQRSLYNETNSLPVSALSIAEDFSKDFFEQCSNSLLMLGGDHSVSYPIVKSWLEAKKDKRTAIIHFDAHTDLMDERLGIDICFATWAKKIMPYLEKPADLIQLGIRASGKERNFWEETTGAKQFWSSEINKRGPEEIANEVIEYIKSEKIQEVYISFDIDALDAKYASSTGTPEDEGLEPHQCLYIIEKIASNVDVTACDLVEVAPFVSSYKKNAMSPEPETTLLSSQVILEKFLDILK